MQYHSTRNRALTVSGPEAILEGLAPDGGLYVPEQVPKIDFLSWMQDSFAQVAEKVFGLFFDELGEERIARVVRQAYTIPGTTPEETSDDGNVEAAKKKHIQPSRPKFDTRLVTPVHFLTEHTALLELWHGPTLAFKDIALSALPHLMQASREVLGRKEKMLILTATSGDTGKAAMEGFAGAEGFGVAVFYPADGVSAAQRRQMLTQREANVRAWGLEGNFDDCQRGVKKLFADRQLAEELAGDGVVLSSANSINIGRLVPQIIYYITSYSAYVRAGKLQYGQPLDIVVPTGNFGDFLAGFYAREMGLPLGRMTVASNSNHVLSDFGQDGVYDANRPLKVTTSPSMDILISSNLERYLFHKLGDATQVQELMQNLRESGTFQASLSGDVCWGWADETTVMDTIKSTYETSGAVVDPHTAVALAVGARYHTDAPQLVLSTASPLKFPETVLRSVGQEQELEHAQQQNAGTTERPSDAQLQTLIRAFSDWSKMPIPAPLASLLSEEPREEVRIAENQMKDIVRQFGKEV